MGNQSQGSGRQDQQGNKPQAGSTDPNRQGGTQQPPKPGSSPEGNTIERTTDDRGLGRGQRAGGRTDQDDPDQEKDDVTQEKDQPEKSDRDTSGSRPR